MLNFYKLPKCVIAVQCVSTISVLFLQCVTDQYILDEVTASVEADDDSCHEHQLFVRPLTQETGQMEDILALAGHEEPVEDIFLL